MSTVILSFKFKLQFLYVYSEHRRGEHRLLDRRRGYLQICLYNPAFLSVESRDRHRGEEICMLQAMGTLGSRIAAAREGCEMSQSGLARRIGVRPQSISALEVGVSKTSVHLAQIAIVLG